MKGKKKHASKQTRKVALPKMQPHSTKAEQPRQVQPVQEKPTHTQVGYRGKAEVSLETIRIGGVFELYGGGRFTKVRVGPSGTFITPMLKKHIKIGDSVEFDKAQDGFTISSMAEVYPVYFDAEDLI